VTMSPNILHPRLPSDLPEAHALVNHDLAVGGRLPAFRAFLDGQMRSMWLTKTKSIIKTFAITTGGDRPLGGVKILHQRLLWAPRGRDAI
jgi:hypothetical protein